MECIVPFEDDDEEAGADGSVLAGFELSEFDLVFRTNLCVAKLNVAP